MVGQRSLIAQTVLLGVFAPLRENNSAVSSRWNDRSAPWPLRLQKQGGCSLHVVIR